MDKEVLIEILRFMTRSNITRSNITLLEKFSKRIKDESFLKLIDKVFNYDIFIGETTHFIVLKNLTEKMRETNKDFLYAFEIVERAGESKSFTNFGFIIKFDKNTYTMFYGSSENLIDVYYQKYKELNFTEIEFITDDNGKILTVNSEVFNTDVINYFKSKFYYEIFKGDYLDHYINKNNLKLRKLVTNIFD